MRFKLSSINALCFRLPESLRSLVRFDMSYNYPNFKVGHNVDEVGSAARRP